ncbi:hypothetical protein BH10PLA1_BH10PLA1_18020 [soil metagenome]
MSKRSGYKKFLGLVAAIGLGVMSAGQAQAGYTTINAPATGEQSQAQILSHSLGGSFHSSGLNLTNGSVTAVRVNDDNDQLFSGKIKSATTLGTFASYTQGLAIEANHKLTQLFNVKGKGYNAVGEASNIDTPKTYEFVRTGTGDDMSSKNSENADGKDHLVTYLLKGKGIKGTTYVMFFEDKTKQQHSDFDFNDLAVLVKTGCPTAVPLPAAAWSGLATLAGSALVAGYRKRRQLA